MRTCNNSTGWGRLPRESELERRSAEGAQGGRYIEPIAPDHRARMAQARNRRSPANLPGGRERKAVGDAGSFRSSKRGPVCGGAAGRLQQPASRAQQPGCSQELAAADQLGHMIILLWRRRNCRAVRLRPSYDHPKAGSPTSFVFSDVSRVVCRVGQYVLTQAGHCPEQPSRRTFGYAQFTASGTFRMSASQNNISADSRSTRQDRCATGNRIPGANLHCLSRVRQGNAVRLGQDGCSQKRAPRRPYDGLSAIGFRVVKFVGADTSQLPEHP